MIRVLICDDQDVVCEGLRVILNNTPKMEVVGVAHDGAEALEMVSKTRPDLVLMDLKMPGMNGIHATREICNRHPEVRVLVLTTYDADAWVFDAIRSGAAGYLLKDTPGQDIIAAVKGTMEGKNHVDPSVAGKLFTQVAQNPVPQVSTMAPDLSDREKDVLSLLARGMTNATIAQQLHLSEGTVRNYVSIILSKLDVSDRTQAAVIALKYGWADLNEV